MSFMRQKLRSDRSTYNMARRRVCFLFVAEIKLLSQAKKLQNFKYAHIITGALLIVNVLPD